METLLYRFDDPEAYPVLWSETTAKGPIRWQTELSEGEKFIRIAWKRTENDPVESRFAIGLSPGRGVDGRPEAWVLDVFGDNSGARILLEGSDGAGYGHLYELGKLGFAGRGQIKAEVNRPLESWLKGKSVSVSRIEPPISFHVIYVVAADEIAGLSVGFRGLSVRGEVHLVTTAIAAKFARGKKAGHLDTLT